ncbi:HU family DNA-binding protein [Sphingopyxis sp. LARHCG72]
MNASDLVEQLVSEHGVTKAEARELIGTLFSAIIVAAANGDDVSLNGFGKFKIKDSAAREARHPATGETIMIAAARRLTFIPAKAVRDRLND